MTTTGRIELMAPAGNFESLQAALDNGCDSVYFGVEQLNMRARATVNFTIDDLPEIARRCEAKKVRTYLTLNTIIYDHDLSVVKTLLTKAKEAGITAVIASDQAVIITAKTDGHRSAHFHPIECDEHRNRKILQPVCRYHCLVARIELASGKENYRRY